VGDILRNHPRGGISNIVTTPGLMNFQVKIGPIRRRFDTGNIQLNATAHTTLPFWLEILLTCVSDGPGATAAQFIGAGHLKRRDVHAHCRADGRRNIGDAHRGPRSAPALGTAFDSTVANILDLWAGFTISNAGNGVQVQQYMVELLTERN
jgi:hypothetical protein